MLRYRLAFAAAALATLLVGGPMLTSTTFAADEVVVQPGDTLTAISRRHGVSISDIVALNALADPSRIFAGQRLRLAPASVAPTAPHTGAAGNAPPAPSPTRLSHTVRFGEHLTGIARHYGTTIAALVAANGLTDPSRIYAGQQLTVPVAGPSTAPKPAQSAPAPAPAAQETPQPRVHVVRSGEHLTGIARHYGTTIAALVAANGLTDPSRIYAGQQLTVPVEASSTAPKPAQSAEQAALPLPPSMAELVSKRAAVRAVIVEEANRYGVPAAFALAVAWQESGWQQGVVSSAGAIGVMQLLPATGEWVGEAMLGTTVDLTDQRQNVRAGVRLLAHYLDRYDGDRALVLAAYYQGQTAADRHGVYPVTRPYVASIMALERIFGR